MLLGSVCAGAGYVAAIYYSVPLLAEEAVIGMPGSDDGATVETVMKMGNAAVRASMAVYRFIPKLTPRRQRSPPVHSKELHVYERLN